jgi:hypothetical protein
MTLRALRASGAIVLLAAAGPALAGFDLVLKDGITIQADTLRRYGNKYEVRSWSGETMMIDAAEIAQIRASEDPPAAGGADQGSAPANRVRASSEPAGGSGSRQERVAEASEPRSAPPRRAEVDPHMRPSPSPGGDGGTVLSGPPVRPPTPQESLEALGQPSEWSTPSIDPTWKPKDAFGD